MAPSEKQIRKFWFYVEKKSVSECWEWIGAKTARGYGTLSMRIPGSLKQQFYAHRVSYFLCKGAIPPGFFVLHSCDNPSCVNPNHLDLGTNRQNLQDAHDRGLHPVFHRNGPYSGLEKNDLKELLDLSIPRKVLRDKYKLTMAQIQYIRNKGAIMLDQLG